MMRSEPYRYYKAYTKSDTVGFEFGVSDAIFVGTAGSVIATMTSGEAVTFSVVSAGTILEIAATKIGASSTAGGFVILYVSPKGAQVGVTS